MLQTLFGRRRDTGIAIRQVQAQELWGELSNQGAPILVDVRSAQEYERDGHIVGSRLLPLPALIQRHQELPTDQPLVCICRSGNRSQVACEQLAALGFSDLSNLRGGMIGWKASGLPFE